MKQKYSELPILQYELNHPYKFIDVILYSVRYLQNRIWKMGVFTNCQLMVRLQIWHISPAKTCLIIHTDITTSIWWNKGLSFWVSDLVLNGNNVLLSMLQCITSSTHRRMVARRNLCLSTEKVLHALESARDEWSP